VPQAEKLIAGSPRPCNGLTFRVGRFTIASNDLMEWLDRFGIAARLTKVGFPGLVCPEHPPRFAGEPFEELSMAWSLGYLRALFAKAQS
jgi:hypothetical protein